MDRESPMTVFATASQSSSDLMTYALRTAGDPLRFVSSVHQIVRKADSRIPVTRVVTQGAEIDRTISLEIPFANYDGQRSAAKRRDSGRLCAGKAGITDRSDGGSAAGLRCDRGGAATCLRFAA